MFCNKCGAQLPEGSQFCIKCGERLVNSASNQPQTVQKKGKQNQVWGKIVSVLFVLVIIAISICIFIFRDRIQHLGGLGYAGVFLLCFICNATVLAPAPSLVVVVSASLALNPLFVALSGAVGTAFGETVGYAAGYMGKNIVDVENNKLAGWVKKYGTPVIFIFALVPLPLFDIIGIAAGYLRIKFYKFFIACFIGKFIKMGIYAFGANYFIKYMSF